MVSIASFNSRLVMFLKYHYQICVLYFFELIERVLPTCNSRNDHVTSFTHILAGKRHFVHQCPLFKTSVHGIRDFSPKNYHANSSGGSDQNFHPLRYLNLNLISPRCKHFFLFGLRVALHWLLFSLTKVLFCTRSQTVIKFTTKISFTI